MLPDPLHPLIVHFPIALVILAPLVAAWALWAVRRGARPARAWGVPTAVLAALLFSAWLAVATGEREEERVEEVVAEQPIEAHEHAAERFLFATAGVLAIALVGLAGGMVGRIGRLAGTAGAVTLVALGVNVGRTGGDLVYRHGAASAYQQGSGKARPAAEPREDRDDDEARANVNEARSHYDRILPSIRNLHNDTAAGELVACADHLAVALRARGRDDAKARMTLERARATGALLGAAPIGVPANTIEVLDSLREMLDALGEPAPAVAARVASAG